MSKNRNDQIKSLWHAIVTWSRQHWPWGIQVVLCFQDGGEFCWHSTCHQPCWKDQLFVFVMMTLFGRIRIDYSDHYSAPKRIRIEYSVHPYFWVHSGGSKGQRTLVHCFISITWPWRDIMLGFSSASSSSSLSRFSLLLSILASDEAPGRRFRSRRPYGAVSVSVVYVYIDHTASLTDIMYYTIDNSGYASLPTPTHTCD